MKESELVRQAWRVNMLNLALGHQTFEADGATFVVDQSFRSIHDANFMYDVSASSDAEIDALLARARSEYAHARMLTFRLAPWSPPSLESKLALIGVEQPRSLMMVLAGELRGQARAHDLRPLEEDAGWDALREMKRADWAEHGPAEVPESERWEVADGLAAAARLKSPPVRYTMAYVDGRPVGYLNSWEGVDGIGQVEDLFVLPGHRHRGIATALLHHGVAEARSRGAGPIVICTHVGETPKSMYAAMGWRPLAVCRQYAVSR